MTPRFLGLALYAEGPTDHRFLEDVLRRAVEHLLTDGGHSVDVGGVQRLALSDHITSRAERILDGAKRSQGAFHVLFVHADADGDPQRARTERVDPGLSAMERHLGVGSRCGVPVVPVHSTEAWALADYDRLREVLGTNTAPVDLGLPRQSSALEHERHPKELFERAVAAAQAGRKGRRRTRASNYLDLLGECARIEQLTSLPAFSSFLADLARALRQLGFRN